MIKIRSRAPLRISFGGGGTDVSPYVEEEGGVALNATINKYAWTTLEVGACKGIKIVSDDYSKTIFAPNKKMLGKSGELSLIKLIIHKMSHVKNNFKVYLRSDVPPKSGLGGSGAAFVSVIGAFDYLLNEKRMTQYEIAEMAFKLEREDMGIPGGCQDQYATVFGGINFMEFKGNDKVRVNPLKLPKSTIYELEKRLVLAHIGENRNQSVNIIFDQIKSYKENKKYNKEVLMKTKEMAYEMKYALLKSDLDKFGKLIHRAWQEKKRMSKYITTPRIDELYDISRKAGAIGGKITGAGGGGHMLFLCEENKEQKVVQALTEKGCKIIPFSFDFEGLQTWEVRSRR